MKILWLCNVVPDKIAQMMGTNENNSGGWLTGCLDELVKRNKYEFVICFPTLNDETCGIEDNLRYYTFNYFNPLEYNKNVENKFRNILEKEMPDVIHIWGTEFPHCLAMVCACESMGLLNSTVVSIQGLISMYGNDTEHYFAGLPRSVTKKNTLHDFLKHDNIWNQREKFSIRGSFEIQALQKCKNVIGRTEWDRECIHRINPSLQYHLCNENLRNVFYQDSWSYNSCEKHSIFVSQCNYTLKGFHRMLEVMSEIIKKYPDAHLYSTGNSPFNKRFLEEQRGSYYQIYLKKLIRKYELENAVTFCGSLSAEEMKERMLKSNVFVTPSAIENSSNSIGEAMLLGVPCVSSQVGGIRSMVTHGYDGYLYPFNETYLMESYIEKIFENQEIAERLSRNAKGTARLRHCREKNTDDLMRIYKHLV